jgi:GDP-L-fucose synthase
MDKQDPIFVAGARGLVGSGIKRLLEGLGFRKLLAPSREELDLSDAIAVDRFFKETKPAYVFMAAGKVGGIHANSTYPADFIAINLAIALNTVRSAHAVGVKKFLYLGSTCIYPRLAPQPMREADILTGPLEPTNQPYAIAKIAGLELVSSFRRQFGFPGISAMPTNLYGPGDNYDPLNSHVPAALIRRFHEAKVKELPEVAVWGTGTPKREFLHVDDMASGCLFVMEHYDDPQIINIGSGVEITIADFARAVQNTVGYRGRIVFDPSKPDGAPRKLVDSSRLQALGWRAGVDLEHGLASAYEAFLRDHAKPAAGDGTHRAA